MAESIIKLTLVIILLLAGILYWLIPKTGISRYLKMNEPLFIISHIIGLICGLIGLSITFAFPHRIIELHLWELIVIPFVLINVYWSMVEKHRSAEEIFDEKQTSDLTSAAAFSCAISIPAMTALFILFQNNQFSGLVWFPFYMFITLSVYSAAALYYFKRK